MEAAKGCNKDITARTQVICDRCDGKRAEPGTTYSTCSTCKGTGEVLIFFLQTNLQCGHSNQVTWKKIVRSQHFLKRMIFKFFANRPITFINFKGFESFQQLCCWALNVIGQFTKKYLRVFLFPENIVMGQSSPKVSQFECPHCNIVVIKSQNWSTGLVWFLVSFQ